MLSQASSGAQVKEIAFLYCSLQFLFFFTCCMMFSQTCPLFEYLESTESFVIVNGILEAGRCFNSLLIYN